MMRPTIPIALLVLAFSAAPSQGAVRPPSDRSPLGTEQLSDEATVTRWAHPLFAGIIRREPSPSARVAGRLRFFTEDRMFEVYVVLASHVDAIGRTWLRVRIPRRPNGSTGWTLAHNLDKLQVVRTKLRIDRGALRATLFRDGKVIWSSRVGIGGRGTPTPAGEFYIRERLRNLAGSAAYGPWAFGTSAYSGLSDWPKGGVIGIHGTNQPQLIPGRPSHGCVRVPNAKIRQLARLMPIGTPVRIF